MSTRFEKFVGAAVQPEMCAGKPRQNIERAIELTQKAAAAGAKVIVLPELFITGFDYDCIEKWAGRDNGAVLGRLRTIARESSAVIVAGSVSVHSSGHRSARKFFNISYIIGADGRTRAHYEKMHLFPLLKEDAHFTAGTDVICVGTPYGRISPCICFDIRFPEMVRRTMLLGAHILAVPAEFPHPRLDHWGVLLRARAIENQFFVIAANRAGTDATGAYFGHSMIISPYGEVIAEGGEGEEVVLGSIDISEIASVRQALPCIDRINPVFQIRGRDMDEKQSRV